MVIRTWRGFFNVKHVVTVASQVVHKQRVATFVGK
jgi:hypothetical protein